MISLQPVYDNPDRYNLLYSILTERTREQSISHNDMPSMDDHVQFVDSIPYKHWYFIVWQGDVVGSVYISKQKEIGLFVLNDFQGNGIGSEALRTIRKKHPGRLLANINPNNIPSIEFFKKHGFRHIQSTYAI